MFTDVSAPLGIDHVAVDPLLMAGGAAFLDYDGDGDQDLYLTGGHIADALYRNDGADGFVNVTEAAGLGLTALPRTMGVATADVDNDGDRDVFVTTARGSGNLLLLNNGDGTFSDGSAIAGISPANEFATSATFGDVNLDGWVDLYVMGYVEEPNVIRDTDGTPTGFAHECFEDRLYVNNGDGTFDDATAAYGIAENGCGLAVAFTDMDLDADPDLFVVNDFGAWVKPNALLRNGATGDASMPFMDVASASGAATQIYGMGIAGADYDHDGDLDYYMTNLGANVLLQQGASGFTDTAEACGVLNARTSPSLLSTSWGTAFADVDQDGHEDLLVGNGHMPSFDFLANDEAAPDKLFHNNGDGTFSDASGASGFASTRLARGLATADIDGDGDLDVVVAVVDPDGAGDARAILYRNDTAGGNWLAVEVEGAQANRAGIGARVEVLAGGHTWIREIDGGSSYLSQNATTAHIGLGALTEVDEVAVTWPGGRRDVVRSVAAGQVLRVVEGSTTAGETPAASDGLVVTSSYPNPLRTAATIAYVAPGPATLTVHDALGRRVAEMQSEGSGASTFRWDARAADGRSLASGVYFYTLTSGEQSVYGTLTLLP